MIVKGITTTNYNTVGRQQLSNAETQLNNAIRNDSDTAILLKLQKRVDDLKNSIDIREKQREKQLSKMSETERRVQEALFNDVKQKFDETNRLAEERVEKTRDSIKSVSQTVGKAFDSLADNVFHTLLGPLQLIVNPLEQALNFNLFGLAKKPVGDFLESKFPATYENLKKNGGVIGAVGVAIVDAIHKTDGNKISLTSEGGVSSLLGGASFGSILKTAGIVGLIGTAIVGIVAAWKNNWDEEGIESAQDLKKALLDEGKSTFFKVVVFGKYIIKTIFGSLVGGLKSMWNTLKANAQKIFGVWSDPKSSTFKKIWETVKTVIVAIPETIWNGIVGLATTLGDYIIGFFADDEETLAWWTNFKDQLHGFIDDIFGGLKDFFSFDNLKEQWELLKTDPDAWAENLITTIKDFASKIVTRILSAFTGDPDVKWNFDDWWDKVKRDIESWWENTKINPANWFDWFRNKETPSIPYTYTDSKTGEKKTTTVSEWQISAWNPRNWFTWADSDPNQSWWERNIFNPLTWFKSHSVDDAIISKDNDLYIPSPDDNIVLTKNDVSTQLTETTTEFQRELMTVLKEIASNLKQPTVVNNVSSGTGPALNFEGMRL